MRRLPFLVLFIFISIAGYSQSETIYLDSKLKEVKSKEEATYYKIIQYFDRKKSTKTEVIYFTSGEKYSESVSVKIEKKNTSLRGLTNGGIKTAS